jgi:hypothetical protein
MEKMMSVWEQLRVIKEYRTSHATRAFARLYIYVLPIIFGPYYVHVAAETGSPTYSICLAFFTSMAMVALFNVAQALEDPFTDAPPGRLTDAVRLAKFFEEFQMHLDLLHDSDPDGAVYKTPKSEGGVSLGYDHLPPKVEYNIVGEKMGGGNGW